MSATAAPIDLTSHRELTEGLVKDVFNTMLGNEAWMDPEHPEDHRFSVCGALFFVGAWQGAILVELDRPLAFSITAHLEAIPEPTTVDTYVRDAVGEVTNMLAGNLKTLLPAGTIMSIPSVVEGSDFSVSVVGVNTSSRMGFGTPKGAFRITLVQMQP